MFKTLLEQVLRKLLEMFLAELAKKAAGGGGATVPPGVFSLTAPGADVDAAKDEAIKQTMALYF